MNEPPHYMTAPPVATEGDPRSLDGFGGILPVGAVTRGGGVLAAVLGLELHAEGSSLSVLVLSDAPGLLSWDPASGLEVSDDQGRLYLPRLIARTGSLGALQMSVWLSSAIPPDARLMRVVVRDVARTAPGRPAGGVTRLLSGGPWELEVPLLPARTVVTPPTVPDVEPPQRAATGVPARALSGFRGIVPVGQARMAGGAAVLLWALERYADRSVLTASCLTDGSDPGPLASALGQAAVWDDAGRRYAVSLLHQSAAVRSGEAVVEIAPALPMDVRAVGVRVPTPGAGDLDFAIRVPPAA